MHLSEEVIGQASVIVESAEVGAANVADLQLLVARWTGGILEILELTLACFLLVLCCVDLVHFVQGHCDRATFTEDGNFQKAGIDRVGEVGNLLEL